MDYHFFAYLYRLRHIKRWSLMRNVIEENVAEHSYHVALLTHVLCTIGNEVFGRSRNTERAVTMALFHDATEVFTGDIPTPVKHQNAAILANFREIESHAAARLADMVPEELQGVYKPLLTGNRDDDDLRRIVKAADLLEAHIKCTMELSAGNKEFAAAHKQTEGQLKRLDMPEVNYFLEKLYPSLQKTLDELADAQG